MLVPLVAVGWIAWRGVARDSRVYSSGQMSEAHAVLAEAIRLKPDLNTLARLLAAYPNWGNHQYRMLAEKTLWLGLRRAGLPEE